MLSVIPIIMAGGSGSRLWPLSRQQYPKQFLSLVPGQPTMLQATVQRLASLDVAAPLLICNEEHRFLAAEQMRTIGQEEASIILEPVGRNTAPAIALAALHALKTAPDAVLLVLAADHFIPNQGAFTQAVQAGIALAQADKLVTFGVVPTAAETGYGYIECGPAVPDCPSGQGRVVSRFVEKPDAATAQAYLDAGHFLWNSGMFVFKASRYLEALEQFAPAMLQACRAAIAHQSPDMSFIRIDREAFAACPDDSVDYAVMEKTPDAVVVPLDAGWSDVGSWSALWEVGSQCPQGNVCQGDVLLHDTQGSLVHASSRLVAAVGLRDVVIVETKDAVLVADKAQVQEVKQVVEQLKRNKRDEHFSHREVYRPWGVYDSIDSGKRYQVKRITVKPGAKLSVQMHHHRAEHWIVVSGTAKVSNGEKTYLLTENQSTYIPMGQVHALENPGKIPLELIEVQSGSYLGEDDIVRFEDRYGRV